MRSLFRPLAVLVCAVSALTASHVFAQSTQTVQVLEYNGKAVKTPLAYVEVVVSGAGAATSDAQGQLTLRFRTLKGGDAVQVRRVELSGYEVFNREALDQWMVSPSSTFTIVMCRSDRFRQLCDQYASSASQSYARQLQRDKARLDKARRDGQLQEQAYQQQLQAVQDAYDEQLENLDLYVERFARIDLSELSEAESAIIDLVQQGRIDEAIDRYEEMNLLGTYMQQSQNIRQISSAQDSLAVVHQHKQQTLDTLRTLLHGQAEAYRAKGDTLRADSIQQTLNPL